MTTAELRPSQKTAIDSIARWFEGHFPEQTPSWRTIGREAEYPLVRDNGWPIPIMELWPHLQADDLTVQTEGDLITALEGERYTYSSEVGWGTIEVITGPCDDLHQLAAVHEEAVARLLEATAKIDAYLLGYGIQPLSPAHPGLMMKKQRYGALLEIIGKPWLTFAVTASDQVHVDIGREEMIDITNLGNMLAPITVALFANSPIYNGIDSGYSSGREQIMGAIHDEHGRHGMPLRPYTDVADMITALARMPYLIRKENGVAVPDGRSFLQYMDDAQHVGLSAALLDAFLYHEHYIWNAARPRARQGTIELRSACQQPWSEHMVAAAFGLGVVEAGREIQDFLHTFAEAPVAPRVRPGVRQPPDPDRAAWDAWPILKAYHPLAVGHGLAAREPITGMIEGVLRLCSDALVARGRGEEVYLAPLWARLEKRENPAQRIRRIFGTRGAAALIEELKVRLSPR